MKYGRNLSTENKRVDIEDRLGDAKGGGRGSAMDGELGVSGYKRPHLEWTSNEVLLYDTGKYTWSLVMKQDGG